MKTVPYQPNPLPQDVDWVADPPPRPRREPGDTTWWGITPATAKKASLIVAIVLMVAAGVWFLLPAPEPVNVPEGFFARYYDSGSVGSGNSAAGATEGAGPGAISGQIPPSTRAGVEPVGGASTPQETDPPDVIFVHVAGAVEQPGLVRIVEPARVADAITAAGGALPEAQIAAINLAAPIEDGQQIYLPTIEEITSGTWSALAPLLPAPSSGQVSGRQSPGSSGPNAGAVNINMADEVELQQLPGIGPVLAARIVTYRGTHGEFKRVEDLQRVSGIGPALMSQLSEAVTV